MSKTQTVSKPFAGFDDHDACVRENQDKEDPDAFCAWLAEQAKDALSDPNADKVLTSLTTEFVSSVDRPAQDSEWLIFKDATTPRQKAAEVERPYVFAEPEDVAEKAADVDVREENDDGERQIAYAAVLIPNDVDKQGDVIPPYVVERAAHEYMAEYRKMDSDHDLEDGAGVPVESWILKDEQEFDLPDGGAVTYPEGTWVIGKRFVDDEWERVKNGELTGFSIYGGANAVDVGELVDEVEAVNRQAKGASGSTEPKYERMNDSNNPSFAEAVSVLRKNLDDDEFDDVVDLLSKAFDEDEVSQIMGVAGGIFAADRRDTLLDGLIGEGIVDEDDRGDAAAITDSVFEAGLEDMREALIDEDPEGDTEQGDGDYDDEQESSNKNASEPNDMTEQNDAPEDGGTDTEPNDGADGGDDVADGIDELKSMVKGVDDKVDDFDDRLSEVEDEVDALKSAVGDDVPNDRMNDGDVDDDVAENDRMKSVAKQAATEAVAEVAGVDDADDPEVVRKGLREQVGAGADDEPDADLPQEDYSGVVDGVEKSAGGVRKNGKHGNKRFAGGDE